MPRFSAPPSRSPAGMASDCLCGSLQANRPRRGQVHRPATGGNGGVWTRLVWLRTPHFARHSLPLVRHHGLTRFPPGGRYSSAKDQLTAQPVAVKKIMKPFSTPVLSKRTYRELKLLKHLRHENVRWLPHQLAPPSCYRHINTNHSDSVQIISLSDIFISPLEDMYAV